MQTAHVEFSRYFPGSPGLYDKQKRCVAGARGHPSPRVFRDDRRVYVGSVGVCLISLLRPQGKLPPAGVARHRGVHVIASSHGLRLGLTCSRGPLGCCHVDIYRCTSCWICGGAAAALAECFKYIGYAIMKLERQMVLSQCGMGPAMRCPSVAKKKKTLIQTDGIMWSR